MNLMLTNYRVLTILYSCNMHREFFIPSLGRGALGLCIGRQGLIGHCNDQASR